MTKFNYTKICSDFIKDLSEKQKDIIVRRFGLNGKERETLEFIGKIYNITRERVRQIERDALLKLKPKAKKEQAVFQYFKNYLKSKGGLKKEETLLEELGNGKERNEICFLLNLGDDFKRFSETEEFYPLWTLDKNNLNSAQKVVDFLYEELEATKQPTLIKNFNSPVSQNVLASYLGISKKIQSNKEGFFGLKEWPEIHPRGVKDKAYLVFKKEQKPLHFTEVAKLIGSALPQTVHNELIKDEKFVLVGRGIYALEEWGYKKGYIKDVIAQVLQEAKKPLPKEEILNKVLKQRIVQPNTIFLNLSNRRFFSKDEKGKYWIKEA